MSFSTTFTGAKIAQKSILQKQSVDKQISARRTKASSPSTQKKAQIASFGSLAPPDLYPEFGTYPGGGNSLIIPYTDEKNAERELIHGRWAQLGVTGAWAAENGTGIPWFTAGTLCTPDDCTAVADKFPGAVAPLAPEGSGYPNFGQFWPSKSSWSATRRRTERVSLKTRSQSWNYPSPRAVDSTLWVLRKPVT